MDKKNKIGLLTFWIQNSDKIGELPPRLINTITREEVNDLIIQVGELNKKDLIEFRDELKKEFQEEKDKRKEKFEWFKIWIYPFLVPIITTIIIFLLMNNLLNPPKILDVSVGDYYEVPASTDVSLPFLIKNINQYKITIYTPISYRFTWADYNPRGVNFTQITTPKIQPSINDDNSFNNIILNVAGQEDDSKLIAITFKSPPMSETVHVLKIIIQTDHGEVTKEVRLKSTEVKNE